MAINKIDIQDFLRLRGQHLIFDVRSPGEYHHAHIPGAFSLPLFTDEERKVVGTAYKQQSREEAIKIGLDYFGAKMRKMVEQVEAELHDRNDRTVLVHCWRGGMRSAGVAWLLDLYGYKVYTLAGGYKAYRQWARERFESPYPFNVIGGYTGSGKTQVLHELKQRGEEIIDLEELARHRGSAFGAMDGEPAPTQEMFENLLAEELDKRKHSLTDLMPIWLEDESQRIGGINLPHPFWVEMRKAPVCFIEVPFEERLKHIVEEYGVQNKEKLSGAVQRIQKRLGPLETKMTLQFLEEDNITEAFRILLKYYDKQYKKALDKRDNPAVAIQHIQCDEVNAVKNAEKIMTCRKQVKQ
ncbi:MAG TPA: tRNA 2-selenouridine(34) synthase MnmH [Flavipsychrobacter sp.]